MGEKKFSHVAILYILLIPSKIKNEVQLNLILQLFDYQTIVQNCDVIKSLDITHKVLAAHRRVLFLQFVGLVTTSLLLQHLGRVGAGGADGMEKDSGSGNEHQDDGRCNKNPPVPGK